MTPSERAREAVDKITRIAADAQLTFVAGFAYVEGGDIRVVYRTVTTRQDAAGVCLVCVCLEAVELMREAAEQEIRGLGPQR